jgi:hypothetical protein
MSRGGAAALLGLAAWAAACSPVPPQAVAVGGDAHSPEERGSASQPWQSEACISEEATRGAPCRPWREPGAVNEWTLRLGTLSHGTGRCRARADQRRALLANPLSASRAIDAQLLERDHCPRATASLLLEAAMTWHLEAVGSTERVGTGDRATMRRADVLYERVLTSFAPELLDGLDPTEAAPVTLRVRYARADLLSHQRRFAECGPAFDAVAERATGVLYVQAVHGAVHCYAWDREADSRRLIAALDRLLCVEDDPVRRLDAQYARALRHFSLAEWEVAANAFREVAFLAPRYDEDMRMDAAHKYLESLEHLARRDARKRRSCTEQRSRDLRELRDAVCTTTPCALDSL